MSDNKFDKKIAEILNATEVPYEPGSWEGLANKLDRAAPPSGTPEAPKFDEMMRSALGTLEPSYKPEHWNMLAQRLDQEGIVRRVRLHKVAEAAIILLVVVNFQTFLDGGSHFFRMPVPQEQSAPEVPMAHKSHKHQNLPGTTSTIGSAILAPPEMISTTTEQSLSASNYTSTSGSNGSTVLNNTGLPTVPPTIGAAILDPNGQPVPAGLRPLTLLAALGLDAIGYHQNIPMAGISTGTLTKKQRHKSRVYLMASAAMYQQRLKDINGYSTRFNTTEASLRAGVRKGKWGMEAGLAYAPQGYNTDTQVFDFYKQDGITYGLTYDQIHADMVNVPLKVTRQVARAGRTLLHLTAGATAHIAANKSASFKSIQYANLPSGQQLAGKPTIPASKGVLEGGHLNVNSYVTVDAGLRIEHKISPHTSAFIEPQYHRYVAGNGISNEKSRIQAMGVQAGVMAAL
jgi:hypothetical protein